MTQKLNTGSHDLPVSDALAAFMTTGWADTHRDEHGNLTISRGAYVIEPPNALHLWRLRCLTGEPPWQMDFHTLENLLLSGLLHAVKEDFVNTYPR